MATAFTVAIATAARTTVSSATAIMIAARRSTWFLFPGLLTTRIGTSPTLALVGPLRTIAISTRFALTLIAVIAATLAPICACGLSLNGAGLAGRCHCSL